MLVAPDFVLAPGPQTGGTRNSVSRLPISNELSVVLHRRSNTAIPVSLLEVSVWNAPLVATTQPGPGGIVPSQQLPVLEIVAGNGMRIFPLLPQLSSFLEVVPGKRYKLRFDDPSWRRIADGAGHVWPFVATTAATGTPTFDDLAVLFPPNPGSIWGPVAADYPSKTTFEMSLLQGSSYFPATGDPWGIQGKDEKYTPSTGYHGDWPWVHIGAYYARGDRNDLLWVMPTVYRQAARPSHFTGFKATTDHWFNFSRPALWGSSYLGRTPVSANADFIAPIADDHGWWGQDHQHASLRRVAEYAAATGSPWAWEETLHFGELAKAMLRTIDPQPFGPGFPNTPRGYLGWLECAYRAWLLDPTFDPLPAILAMEHFLELGHMLPFGKPWGTPQPMWAQISDKWIPGQYAAASFEDLRSVPVMLKLGEAFNRPKLILGALENCQWYCTTGFTNGAEGKGKGIKRIVAPLDPSVFVEADLSGYNRVSGLGLKLASEYLTKFPTAGFDKNLYLSVAQMIQTEAKASIEWTTDLVGYLPW